MLRTTALCFIFLALAQGMVLAQADLGITAEDVARDPAMWPREVTLKKKSVIKLGTVGEATYEAGTRVSVIRVTRDSVVAQLAGRETSIPIADTTLLETATASFSGARARQRLIEEANQLPPIPDTNPTPTPVPTAPPGPVTSQPSSEGGLFSDTFRDPTSIARWTRVTNTEGRNIDMMESISTGPYGLTLVPYSSGWFNEYRAELFYQPVQGDFIMQTLVGVSSRNNPSAYPSSPFSLAGLMLRIARSGPSDALGQENYVFVGVGVGADVTQPVVEFKSTIQSVSTVRAVPCKTTVSHLMIARVGGMIFVLFKSLGADSWSLALKGKFESNTPDQLGFTAYTDYPRIERAGYATHNTSVLRNGNPDLRATFASITVTRPKIDTSVISKLSSMSDQEIVDMLTKP